MRRSVSNLLLVNESRHCHALKIQGRESSRGHFLFLNSTAAKPVFSTIHQSVWKELVGYFPGTPVVWSKPRRSDGGLPLLRTSCFDRKSSFGKCLILEIESSIFRAEQNDWSLRSSFFCWCCGGGVFLGFFFFFLQEFAGPGDKLLAHYRPLSLK